MMFECGICGFGLVENYFPSICYCAGQISQDIVAKRLLTHNLRSAIFTQFKSTVVEAIVPVIRKTIRIEILDRLTI
jgi:hypothetical protein